MVNAKLLNLEHLEIADHPFKTSMMERQAEKQQMTVHLRQVKNH